MWENFNDILIPYLALIKKKKNGNFLYKCVKYMLIKYMSNFELEKLSWQNWITILFLFIIFIYVRKQSRTSCLQASAEELLAGRLQCLDTKNDRNGKQPCCLSDLKICLRIQHDPQKWRLFIDSCKLSLKVVLLHSGNSLPSVPAITLYMYLSLIHI